MFILEVVSACNDYALAHIFMIIQKAFNILQILVPIMAIISLAVSFVKITLNPDGKKNNLNLVKNCVIALVIVFMLPTIVNAVMGLMGDSYSISSCWNNAEGIYRAGESNYNGTNEGEKKPVTTNPGAYGMIGD